LGSVQFYRDKELPFFEMKMSECGDLSYIKHAHEEYSIGLVQKGNSSFWCEGKVVKLMPRTLVLIPPGAIHVCSPDQNNMWEFKMLYLNETWVGNLLNNHPHNSINYPSVNYEFLNSKLFTRTNQLLDSLANSSNSFEKESNIISFFSQIIRWKKSNINTDNKKIRHKLLLIREYLHSCFLEKITLDQLEHISGLSKCHIVRSFKEEFYISPHLYLTLLRINYAKIELRKQAQISLIAQNTGFYDQSHFDKVFKRYVGVTPQKYQISRG